MKNNNDMKFNRDQKVKLVADNTNVVYKIVELFHENGLSPEFKEVNIQTFITEGIIQTDGSIQTVKRKDLRVLDEAEKRAAAKLQRISRSSSAPKGSATKTAVSSHAQTPERDTPPASTNPPLATTDMPPLAPEQENRPSSEAVAKTPSMNQDTKVQPEDGITPIVEMAGDEIPYVPMSRLLDEIQEVNRISNLDFLPKIEQIVEGAFIHHSKELKAIPSLYSFVLKLVEGLPKQDGESGYSFEHTGTSVAHVQSLLKTLEAQVKDLSKKIEDKETEISNRTGELNNLQVKLDKQVAILETEKGQNLAEIESLNGEIGREKEKADKAEQAEHKVQENTISTLKAFWLSREEFYDGLHRAIKDLQAKDRKRFHDDIVTRIVIREELLKTDIALLEGLSCEVILKSEALEFMPCEYDGAIHKPFSDDESINHSEAVTVLLPGWIYGDNIKVKPTLGHLEINQ